MVNYNTDLIVCRDFYLCSELVCASTRLADRGISREVVIMMGEEAVLGPAVKHNIIAEGMPLLCSFRLS